MSKEPMTPKEKIERARGRRELLAKNLILHACIMGGILAKEMLPEVNLRPGSLRLTLTPVTWGAVGAAAVLSVIVFAWAEKRGSLEGKFKNLRRLGRAAFLIGFFWSEVVSRFEF